MDRRKSLKLLATGALATPLVLEGCKSEKKEEKEKKPGSFSLDRNPEEIVMEQKLLAQPAFFTADEMATLTVLVDIIIPADSNSGSASQAGVPAFLEFIVKDMPQHQVPLRGGLRWLDMHSLKMYNHSFLSCTPVQRTAIIDQIAYPQAAQKEVRQGVQFFSLLRNLTATGFYTSALGVKDLEYSGNQPNVWDGVPQDVLRQYELSYTEKDLSECIKHDNRS